MLETLKDLVVARDKLALAISSGYVDAGATSDVDAMTRRIEALIKQ